MSAGVGLGVVVEAGAAIPVCVGEAVGALSTGSAGSPIPEQATATAAMNPAASPPK